MKVDLKEKVPNLKTDTMNASMNFQKIRNFVSLGFFCEATEILQQEGLRTFSGPFDWTISDFQGILKAIDTHFEGFFDLNNFYQNISIPSHYMNKEYEIEFFHDFSKYKSLTKQFAHFSEKYQRRIDRFYKSVKIPTLFLRYVKGQEEIDYIVSNYPAIMERIRKFNPDNVIIFVANDDLDSSKISRAGIPIFLVSKDPGDIVSRNPLKTSPELRNFFGNFPKSLQDKKSIAKYKKIQRKQRSLVYRIPRHISRKFKEAFFHEYSYFQKYH